MGQVLRPAALVPPGLVVDSIVMEDVRTVITVRALDAARRCPSCGSTSSRLYSRYLRTLLDLPLSGRAVQLVVLARRFRCGVAACSQRIFTERFGNDILRPCVARQSGWRMRVNQDGLLRPRLGDDCRARLSLASG